MRFLLRVAGISCIPSAMAALPVLAGYAPFTQPRVAPDAPTAADAVTYAVGWDGCGSLEEPVIRTIGRVVEVTQPVDAICSIPIGGEVRYDLGRFAPGDYRVRFAPCQRLPDGECFPLLSPEDVFFDVRAAVPMAAAVPALSSGGAVVAALGLVATVLVGSGALRKG